MLLEWMAADHIAYKIGLGFTKQFSNGNLNFGSLWYKGKPSRDVNDIDFVPSKFPTGHLKPKTEQDIARHERVR